jgi:hypothetical protein
LFELAAKIVILATIASSITILERSTSRQNIAQVRADFFGENGSRSCNNLSILPTRIGLEKKIRKKLNPIGYSYKNIS